MELAEENVLDATLVAVKDADVRVDPDGLSSIFMTLGEGIKVTVIGQEGDWYVIQVGSKIGYIYKDDLAAQVEEDTEEPAEAEEPAEEEPTEAEEPAEKEPVAEEPVAEEPVAEEEPVEKKVTIFSSRRTVMNDGEEIYLTSKIEGFDGCEVIYQWECDQGEGFRNIQDANGDTYMFIASVETLSWKWRLTVYYR